MGSDRYAVPGRAHRDLVAIYESRSRELALLLRQTVVPLAVEHDRWLVETRKVARAVRADLRAAGFDGRVLILQWQPLETVARVLREWTCRYDGDPARRREVQRVVARHLDDREYIARRLVATRAAARR